MRPEMTSKQGWVCVELPCGEHYIPASLVNINLIRDLMEISTNEALPKDLTLIALQKLDDEIKGHLPTHDAIYSVEIVRGYGVKTNGMSWQVYTNKRDAEMGLKDMALVDELCKKVDIIDARVTPTW